jgi:hypothetical protein
LAQNQNGVDQSPIWIIPLLGFSGMLVMAALVLAFQTRKVPDYFSDSKHVALSVYNMVIVGLTMIAAMFLIQGNPDAKLLVRVVAVSISVISTVTILFVSKASGIRAIDGNLKVGHLANLPTEGTTRDHSSKATMSDVSTFGGGLNAPP